MKKKSWDFLKIQQTKKQKAEKVANWIINSILKLPDEDLKQLYLLLENELKKRGVF